MLATLAIAMPTEALVIAGIIVIIFGARKLPDIGKGLGQGIKEFKSATKKAAAEEDEVAAPPAAPPTLPPQEPTG